MAFIEQTIYSELVAATGLNALIGTRVYPLVAPEGATMPAIVIQRISGGQISSLGGFSGLERPRFQFSCYGDTYGAAKNAARQLRIAIEDSTNLKAVCENDIDQYDKDAKLFRSTVDFYIWANVDLVNLTGDNNFAEEHIDFANEHWDFAN